MGNDDVGRGIESALAMLLFLGAGWVLDEWFGTRPLFTIILVVLVFVGTFARTFAGYSQRMDRLESHRVTVADRSVADRTNNQTTAGSTGTEGT
jgi:Putative F0F1-ATPase subunit Ca2+/Mg2+ transporter